MKSTVLMLIGLGLAAMPVAAQQHGHEAGEPSDRPMMGHCQMMQGGMAMMGGGMGMMSDSMGMMRGMGSEGMMNMPMRGVMMQGMRLWPRYLVGHRTDLGLTDDQVAKLEALGQRDPTPMTGMPGMRAAQEQLAKAFEAGDASGIRAASERMAKAHADMQARHLVLAVQARDVLTAEQRAKLGTLPGPCSMMEGGRMMQQGGHEQHHR